MVALKDAAVERFLENPDRSIVLVYGPDSGLVSERAKHLLDCFAGKEPDALNLVAVEGDELAQTPRRLAEEAYTISLFGGKRVIRVTLTSKAIARSVEPLLDEAPEAAVVIEAGELKPSSPLRKLVEKSESAAALPCYVDDARAIDRLIDQEATAAGLKIDPNAQAALHRLLGADRATSRNELRKLMLYSTGNELIGLSDIEAVSADSSAFALDSLTDETGLGESAAADRSLQKALAAGTSPIAVFLALGRHFRQLSLGAALIRSGATAESAMRRFRPPVFFKRQVPVRRQLGHWRSDDLERALDLIRNSDLEARRRPDLAKVILERTVLVLAGAGRSRR